MRTIWGWCRWKIPAETGDAGAYHQAGEFDVAFLLVEPAQVTVRSVPEWRSKYLHLMMRRGWKTAKVAMEASGSLMRQGWDYEQWKSSVRRWDSPDIAMVSDRTPRN